jgi:hypothetical protein
MCNDGAHVKVAFTIEHGCEVWMSENPCTPGVCPQNERLHTEWLIFLPIMIAKCWHYFIDQWLATPKVL